MFSNKPAELEFNIKDVIGMGVGIMTPLLISGFLKTPPKHSEQIYFFTGMATSYVASYVVSAMS